MDEKNKCLNLVASEVLINMQQLQQETREGRPLNQQRHEEMIQVFNRTFELVIDELGEIKNEVKEVRTTAEKIDKRVATMEESLTGEYERRLRVPEEIALKKAS